MKHMSKAKLARSIKIAEYMRERAHDYRLNPDQMYILGLLHNIGFLRCDDSAENTVYGAHLLDTVGFKYSEVIRCFNRLTLRSYFISSLISIKKAYTHKSKYIIGRALVLLVEANMSIDESNKHIELTKYLDNIKAKYGELSAEYEFTKNNVDFIYDFLKYWKVPAIKVTK